MLDEELKSLVTAWSMIAVAVTSLRTALLSPRLTGMANKVRHRHSLVEMKVDRVRANHSLWLTAVPAKAFLR